MDGIVVVDKPEGPTSFDVVARLRQTFGTRSIGHCGTLDPLASGVLVVAVGEYTKLVRILTADDKRYLASIAFGASTTTDDREGDVIARGDAADLDEAKVRAALWRFVGASKQKPPAFSAIHVDGERAYEKARKGEAVELADRDVVVHGLELLAWAPGPAASASASALVDVRCGKGTYVRALARDVGAAVGVPAHLGALRRTESGAYTLADAKTLDSVGPGDLVGGVGGLRGVPLVEVDDAQAKALSQGKRVPLLPSSPSMAGTGVAHLANGSIVAIVHVDEGRLVVERGFGYKP